MTTMVDAPVTDPEGPPTVFVDGGAGGARRARSARVRRRPSRLVASAGVLAIVAALLYPVVLMGRTSLLQGSPLDGFTGAEATFGTDAYGQLWTTITAGNALVNSLMLAVAVTVIAVAAAGILAYLSERTNVPFARAVLPAALLTMTISPLFYAIGYDLLANPYTGGLNALLELAGIPGDLLNVESWAGLVFVEAAHLTGIAYFLVRGPVSSLSQEAEEAALVSGSTRVDAFWRVSLRLLIPSLVGAGILVFIIALQIFDSGLILGDPAGIHLLSVELFELLTNNVPPKFADASAVGVVMLIVIAALAVVQQRVVGQRSFVTITARSGQAARIDLGAWRWLGGAVVVAYLLVALLLPIASIFVASLQGFPGSFAAMGFQNYEAILTGGEMGGAFLQSVSLGIGGGFGAAAVAFLVSGFARRSGRFVRASVESVLLVPLALPTILAAAALSWAFATLPVVKNLYGTTWVLLVALILINLPITFQVASAAYRQLPADLESAAAVSGASDVRRLIDVTLPLLSKHFVSAWIVSAVLIFGALDVPLVLGSVASPTLPAYAYTLYRGNAESEAAAVLMLSIAAVIVAFAATLAVQSLTGRRDASLKADRP